MKNLGQSKKFRLFAGIFILMVIFTGCSSDNEVEDVLPTGRIQIKEWENLSGNILTVPHVIVGQDSWIAAVEEGEETSNNFITTPVKLAQGITSNVQLAFDESSIKYLQGSQYIVLKLYADNQKRGTRGEWDIDDIAITFVNNVLLIYKVIIVADLTNFDLFKFFDKNRDGALHVEEISNSYSDKFPDWAGDKAYIFQNKFYSIMYHSTDTDYYDPGISEAEWNEGYLRMYGNWTEDNFSAFDLDKNKSLNEEEWHKIFKESDWFATYDSNLDNILTQEELEKGFFEDWDYDNDGLMDKEEFNNSWLYIKGFSDGYRSM